VTDPQTSDERSISSLFKHAIWAKKVPADTAPEETVARCHRRANIERSGEKENPASDDTCQQEDLY